jgi:glycosyltransferase involved in cell wall biosynthesis
MRDTDQVWIVIPAYQARDRIGGVLRAAAPLRLPMIVVDDGSDDGTGEEAEAVPGVVVLRHARNCGKGAALQTGFACALRRGATAVLTLDADGQHEPAEIPALLKAHKDAPKALVIGVRSFDPRLMPRRSRTGNIISTFFISRFCGRPHRDTQSGFRIYPAALLRRAPLRTKRFDTEAELLLWASKLAVPLVEVPIRTIYHGHGHGHGHGHDHGQDPGPEAGGLTHVTHFRTLTDTLRVIRLVAGSPFWRVTAAGPPSDGLSYDPEQKPKMEASV